jgi:hypothetical protein
MQTIPKEIREAFMKIVESGDEAKAREFLVENLSQFPEDTQEVITMAFFEEALAKKDESDQLVADLKTQGLEAVNVIDRAKEELEKHVKLAEIKESI